MSGPVSYVDVKSEIVERIRRGDWAVDALIPGEVELAAELGCARGTVNRALRELAAEGVVERRRKAGTRVTADRNRPARIDIPLVRSRIEAEGARYGYRLLGRRVVAADSFVAERLAVAPGSEVLSIECLHSADDVPHQLERRWINLAAVPSARAEPFDEIGPNEWLVREKPLTDFEHVIGAENAGPAEAARLAIAVGDALLVVERRTWLGADTITYVRLLHAGASFRLCSHTALPVMPLRLPGKTGRRAQQASA